MPEIKTDENDEDILPHNRYRKWSKVLLVIGVLYVVWIIFVIMSIYFLEMGYRWSFLSMNEWIYSGIFLLGLFVLIELIFFARYYVTQKEKLEGEKPKPLMYKGKRLYIYTCPPHAKGGLFSRTYIPVDENTIVRVKTQMIPPEELWKTKEE